MLRITGGKVYDPANGIDGVIKDICIADGRIVANVEGGRTIDASGMMVFPGGVDVHTHVAGGALNFARGLVPENQRAARKFLHVGPPRRARRHDAHHVRHRLSLRRHGLDDGQRGGGADSLRPAHARRAARHADRGQVLPRADGEQRDRAGPARSRRGRTGQARRRLADLGRESVRRQGGESRRRRGVEVGKNANRCTSRSRATRPSRRRRSSPASRRSSTSWSCRTRFTCTATISACRATSRPRSRR